MVQTIILVTIIVSAFMFVGGVPTFMYAAIHKKPRPLRIGAFCIMCGFILFMVSVVLAAGLAL